MREPCSSRCPQGECANCAPFDVDRRLANDILDRHKAGETFDAKAIDLALRATGDSVTTFGSHARAHLAPGASA